MTDAAPLVILVDDEQAILKGLGRLLGAEGFDVEKYSSPLEFLERSSPDRPCCAVLDLSMPEMDGLTVHETIVQREWPCGVIFLTGTGDIPSTVRAMKLGATDFLTKPVDADDLLRAVREALERQEQVFELNEHYDDLKSRFEPLTPREKQVMEFVVNGHLNKQIAGALEISEKTVKAHRAKVMQKTGVRSLASLVQMYFEMQQANGDK